jgi:hypothetical protein
VFEHGRIYDSEEIEMGDWPEPFIHMFLDLNLVSPFATKKFAFDPRSFVIQYQLEPSRKNEKKTFFCHKRDQLDSLEFSEQGDFAAG